MFIRKLVGLAHGVLPWANPDKRIALEGFLVTIPPLWVAHRCAMTSSVLVVPRRVELLFRE